MKLVFPTAFVPYNNIPSLWGNRPIRDIDSSFPSPWGNDASLLRDIDSSFLSPWGIDASLLRDIGALCF